jgi:hypothetical protein
MSLFLLDSLNKRVQTFRRCSISKESEVDLEGNAYMKGWICWCQGLCLCGCTRLCQTVPVVSAKNMQKQYR